ncbi:hypothetical protein A2U01_0020603 [Trifolium medium]|uniref:Uncharacterized protein n=1 Tax=Trifolium medium TaxID=97028 RepID=A0A392NJZ9_9FABA|nr:hypothetical protein [Trifolium medium]
MDNASSFGFARRLSKARNRTDRELGQAQRRNNERPKRHWRALKEWKMKVENVVDVADRGASR